MRNSHANDKNPTTILPPLENLKNDKENLNSPQQNSDRIEIFEKASFELEKMLNNKNKIDPTEMYEKLMPIIAGNKELTDMICKGLNPGGKVRGCGLGRKIF